VRCDESSKNYSSIPSKLNKNVSVLNLSYNNIALNETDTDILYNYTNIKELYLNNNVIVVLCNYSFQSLSELAILDVSSNSITTIEQAAFFGLNKLMTLQLQNNEIEQLDFTAVRFLKNLQVLNLQNNHLKYVAINVSLNSDETILSGNPWYCLCGLYVSGVQSWLNDTNIKIEYVNNAVCTLSNSLKKSCNKTVLLQNCGSRKLTGANATSSTFTYPHNDTVISAHNDTHGNSSNSGDFYAAPFAETLGRLTTINKLQNRII
ncbi:Leucine-rich repeat-containing protein 19, partial [Varanus komodoensis]